MNCEKKINEVADRLNQEEGNQRGASLVEYALLVALIAVVAITAVTTLGRTVSERFSSVSSSVAGASN